MGKQYQAFLNLISEKKKALAILIDPEEFDVSQTASFLKRIPNKTTHIFVGGSTVDKGLTKATVTAVKKHSDLPIFLFPGDYNQVCAEGDAVLFLSLLSGRNAEYLIGQQVKAIPNLVKTSLEIISTGYLLIDGGNESAVARVSKTLPMSQENVQAVVDTALAGQYLGAKLIYLEAGSGATIPVKTEIISSVKQILDIPLIIGGGIRTELQIKEAYNAGADLIVMGTAFEK